MRKKNNQRLALGATLVLAAFCTIYLLKQPHGRVADVAAAVALVEKDTILFQPTPTSYAPIETSAGITRSNNPALPDPLLIPTGPSSAGAHRSLRSSETTLADAQRISTQEILPNIDQPVKNWKEYTPELLTIMLPSGRIVDYAMTSVREENNLTIWNGRSDMNDASSFLVTVATKDTWYVETKDIETENNVIYYITGASVRRIVTAPLKASCNVTAASAMPAADIELQAAATTPSQLAAAGTYTVDVLFLYDKAALKYASGETTFIKSRIMSQLDLCNLALENSGVNSFRWRFVEMYEAPSYGTEVDPNPQGVLALVSNPQSEIGAFAYQRAQYHSADQVVMYFGLMDEKTAGVGTCPGHYCVAHFGWRVDYSTLAHEMGHNFGCVHDRDETSTKGKDGDGKYNYGYLFTAAGSGTYGTIMSYAGTIAYPRTTRIDFYSNPTITYMGVPIGVPEGAPRAANNARVLRDGGAIMSSYRTPPAEKPFIVIHPQSGQYGVGTTVTLSVRANMEQVFYQWRKNGNDISGANSEIFSFCGAQESDAGRYSVHVSNIKGGVTSNDAMVGVGSNTGWGWGYGTGTMAPGSGPGDAAGGGAAGWYYLAAMLALMGIRYSYYHTGRDRSL